MAAERDTDAVWTKIAQEDAYFGVLSEEIYRKDVMNAEAHQRFMATGEKYVGEIFALIEKHLVPGFAPRRVLDLGCGVGRHLLPMARRADEAVGVDIAQGMLDICRKNAEDSKLDNVKLIRNDDDLNGVDGPFDFVNSYFVLQHIPPKRGYKLLQAMLDRTATGGVVSLELTYAHARRFFFDEEPTALYYRREGAQITDIMSTGWDGPPDAITMYDYDLNEVFARIAQVAGPMVVLPTDDESHLGLHCVFVRAR